MDDDPVPGGAPDPDADPIEPPRAADPATQGEVTASPASPTTAGPAGWIAPSGMSSGGRSPVLVFVLGCAAIVLLLFASSTVGLIYLGSQMSVILDPAQRQPQAGTVYVLDLRVGDCFDEPAASADGMVVDLIERDCAEAHAFEVTAIVQVPDGGAWPGDDAVSASAEAQCGPAFVSYVGSSPEASIYDVAWYSVTEEGWQGGDRSIDCLAFADDESPTTGSAKGANR